MDGIDKGNPMKYQKSISIKGTSYESWSSILKDFPELREGYAEAGHKSMSIVGSCLMVEEFGEESILATLSHHVYRETEQATVRETVKACNYLIEKYG